MRRFVGLAVVGLGLWLWAGEARAQFAPFVQGGSAAPSCVGYSGPGDVATGWTAWWGLRAFSCLDRGNVLANVCMTISTVDTCVDMSSDATTGNIVLTTIGGLTCNNSTQICNVQTLYDQTGNSNDITRATVAQRPTITTSCLGSLPCLAFAHPQFLEGSVDQNFAAPFSATAVFFDTTATGGHYSCGTCMEDGNTGLYSKAGVIDWYVHADQTLGGTTVSNWYATIGVAQASTGTVNANGSSAAATATTSLSGTTFAIGDDGGGDFLDGNWVEAGWLGTTGLSSGQITSLTSNERTYWGI